MPGILYGVSNLGFLYIYAYTHDPKWRGNDFRLRNALLYSGVNNRAELLPLGQSKICIHLHHVEKTVTNIFTDFCVLNTKEYSMAWVMHIYIHILLQFATQHCIFPILVST